MSPRPYWMVDDWQIGEDIFLMKFSNIGPSAGKFPQMDICPTIVPFLPQIWEFLRQLVAFLHKQEIWRLPTETQQ